MSTHRSKRGLLGVTALCVAILGACGGGGDSSGGGDGDGGQSSLDGGGGGDDGGDPFGDGGLTTERTPPPEAHPRLFGDDDAWLARVAPIGEIPCNDAGGGWGEVTNFRDTWDRMVLGAAPCRDEDVPTLLADHPAAAPYLAAEPPEFDMGEALTLLFVLRRADACHRAGGNGCQFTAADIVALKNRFIAAELARFAATYQTSDEEKLDPGYTGPADNRNRNRNWCTGYAFGYDLSTSPLVRYWSIFLDTLWNDLTVEQRELIAVELRVRAGAWLKAVDEGHWSYANGNNWSPILSVGIAWYAIALYHEDDRAERLLDTVVDSMHKHEGFYLADGGYKESVSYVIFSFDTLADAEKVYQASLGATIGAYPPARMMRSADWVRDFVATDGRLANFGDAHAYRGHALTAIELALWPEIRGDAPVGSLSLDPCWARDIFMNKYYANGFTDPWQASPTIARDWLALVAACDAPAITTGASIYPEFGAVVRAGAPGTSQLGMDDTFLRYLQADGALLHVSAVPNTYPHMELDFGALIWSAYGNRLLADVGYGKITSGRCDDGACYDVAINGDFVPSGANTLVVPEAQYPGLPGTDLSQLYGQIGTVLAATADGRQGIDVDASRPYGRDDESGWLSGFHRYAFPLAGANILVIDAMSVKAARVAATPAEHFFAPQSATVSCGIEVRDVAITPDGDDALRLTPRCSALRQYSPAEGVGRIHGASLREGGFVIDGVSTIEGQTRTRFRWAPASPLTSDVRAFVLASAPSAGALPAVTLQVMACGDHVCVTGSVGAEPIDVEVAQDVSGDWALVP